jgi:uncharacterized UBP type Zn finger protein
MSGALGAALAARAAVAAESARQRSTDAASSLALFDSFASEMASTVVAFTTMLSSAAHESDSTNAVAAEAESADGGEHLKDAFVGLRNQGLTCYLNAVVQLLYMTSVRGHISVSCSGSLFPVSHSLCSLALPLSSLRISRRYCLQCKWKRLVPR